MEGTRVSRNYEDAWAWRHLRKQFTLSLQRREKGFVNLHIKIMAKSVLLLIVN